MRFACTDRVPKVTAGSLCPARRQKLSGVLQWTTVNVLIFDTGRLFLPHPDPTPLSLFLSRSGSLGQTESRCLTARPQPNLTPQHAYSHSVLPHLLNVLVSLEDICHLFCCSSWISSDADRKAADTGETKAGFNSVLSNVIVPYWCSTWDSHLGWWLIWVTCWVLTDGGVMSEHHSWSFVALTATQVSFWAIVCFCWAFYVYHPTYGVALWFNKWL